MIVYVSRTYYRVYSICIGNYLSRNKPSLNIRKKWNKVQRNVKVINIVLLYNSNMPRSFSTSVIKVHLSKDQLVQSVTLKLPNATLNNINHLSERKMENQ